MDELGERPLDPAGAGVAGEHRLATAPNLELNRSLTGLVLCRAHDNPRTDRARARIDLRLRQIEQVLAFDVARAHVVPDREPHEWGFTFDEIAGMIGVTAVAAPGVLLVWIAARENTPAHRLPAPWVNAAPAATWLILIAIAGWTFAASPKVLWSDVALARAGIVCVAGGSFAGAVLMAAFASAFRDALAARPSLTGALYGSGAGIVVNACWRLACPFPRRGTSLPRMDPP